MLCVCVWVGGINVFMKRTRTPICSPPHMCSIFRMANNKYIARGGLYLVEAGVVLASFLLVDR